MTNPDTYHAFPLARVAAVLTAVATASALLALGVMAGLGMGTKVQLAAEIGVAVAYVGSVVGVMPVFIYGPLGVQATQVAYFVGMGARLALCLLAALLCVYAFHLPGQAALLSLGGAYVPLLFVEVAFVGRYLTQKDSLKPVPPGPPGPAGPVAAAGSKEAMA